MSKLFNGKLNLLSGNMLKIIAALTMVIDHVGYLLFPEIVVLRIIGRLSFPIFAFMIVEGCKYTRNKLRYFLNVSLLAFLCQIVYFFFSGSKEMYSLVCFALSIPIIYLLQFIKKNILSTDVNIVKKIVSIVLFFLSIFSVYVVNKLVSIDYGFWGCMLPVITSLLTFENGVSNKLLAKLDNKYVKTLLLAIGILLLCIEGLSVQPFALLSIPLILLYSGKRGKYNMKYYFYAFYPLHFVIIYILSLIF